MSDEQKESITQRIGGYIDSKIGADSSPATKQAMGERRLQTWLLSFVVAPLCVYVVVLFAGIPSQLSRVADKLDAVSVRIEGTLTTRDAAAQFAQLTRRIDAGDMKDETHDAKLESLTRRVDRAEYVIEVAPATAAYARAAHVQRQKKPDPGLPATKPEPAVKPNDD